MSESQGSDVDEMDEVREFRSPARVLLRSYRLGRDSWRAKHHAVQKKLEQERQLSTERGESRDRWRSQCEAAKLEAKAACERAEVAEFRVQQRSMELEQAYERLAQIEAELPKKN
jgi:hypothetical protein